ncbi:MAG: zinc ABC transporter substrate-binding protein [Gemmataceae bacterium]|uniref:Zinc ABC transporter substrate-binding protein n=1 Tax=Thermogemmata fonticola TaxID=2755323 RepID=A0A7V8VFV1_9BACT|nr:zinc ABC transporter substrate-binding protein [Thermogemmata fonticola]MBA2227279.1 zinc ABC transporter substrate-binding protein [Thermogemmata fonticola]MCX8138655.1 zinc ABC transporter substrate-binding protein [Gemmataceae bacterium]
MADDGWSCGWRRWPRLLRVLLAVWLAGAAGCTGRFSPHSAQEQSKVRVVCTTTIVADLVQQVGGERVHVETLMGPGVDPHKYIAGIGDIRKLQSAQAVFINGLHLEGKMADLLERNRRQWRVHAVTDPLPREQLLPAEEDATVYDPHVWFDVLLWAQTVEGVRQVLSDLDPQGEAYYAQRAAAYREQLQQLDREIRQELARVPPERRVLITAHDAFRYFGRAYGWEVIGLQGVSTASELGTQQRERLARLIVERAIPAVFTETSVPPEGLQAVLDDVRRKQGPLVRLISDQDALYSDALGPADSPAGTYTGMIRHNVRVLVRALGSS